MNLVSPPVTDDGVIACALRLSVVPLVDHVRAVAELVAIADREPLTLHAAWRALRDDTGRRSSSNAVRGAAGLLADALHSIGVAPQVGALEFVA